MEPPIPLIEDLYCSPLSQRFFHHSGGSRPLVNLRSRLQTLLHYRKYVTALPERGIVRLLFYLVVYGGQYLATRWLLLLHSVVTFKPPRVGSTNSTTPTSCFSELKDWHANKYIYIYLKNCTGRSGFLNKQDFLEKLSITCQNII